MPDIPLEVLQDIEKAIFDTFTSSPFCPRCKKLSKQIAKDERNYHLLGEQVKSFNEFLHAFDCN